MSTLPQTPQAQATPQHEYFTSTNGLSIENKFQANKRICQTWMLLRQP